MWTRGGGNQGQERRSNPPTRQFNRQGSQDNRQNQSGDSYRAIDTADEDSPGLTDAEDDYLDDEESERCGACGPAYDDGEN